MNRRTKTAAALAVVLILSLGWLLYPAPGVPILAYHKVCEEDNLYAVSPGEFEEQMRYLAEHGYTAISLRDYFAAASGERQLPDKPVIITFDDGYDNNYLQALPIMEKYGMHGTVFVVSGYVEAYPGYLSWPQIADMLQRGTEIGSHTASHVQLDQISLEERRQEIVESKSLLEQHTGVPVEFLAYPYGGYDQATEDILREAGYIGACSGEPGLNQGTDHAYALKRINIPHPKWGLWEFRLRLLRADIYSKLNI
ncbi:hypothetical protein P22_0434 [Propionispora sp. 2/2-37]|uniref:polysaccharide deacetylase family protein n=1 Tax=Propionispora sp. 2/2-37 TaxID=1677858 RepID=UPI0006BB6533|nr:polysaccharide deacetylase family protein [Propionispora sp. 2/2-37]CUH94368.1 hypothetical protein P22_0434 [Propionispora sp. 2/2-37]